GGGVEPGGWVSGIGADKAGALTLMEMVVASAVTADSTYQITGEGYASEGQVLLDGKPAAEDPVLKLFGRVSMLCNDSELRQEDGTWKVEGDPTEAALYPFASKLGLERRAQQTQGPRLDRTPFRSDAPIL